MFQIFLNLKIIKFYKVFNLFLQKIKLINKLSYISNNFGDWGLGIGD